MNELKLNNSIYDINQYFAWAFSDGYGIFAKEKNNVTMIEYLNDEFIDIELTIFKLINLKAILSRNRKEPVT